MRRTIYIFAIAFFQTTTAFAQSGELSIQISVADSTGSGTRLPSGDTRWLIEGKDEFLLAEQHGSLPMMRYQLPLGVYQITVWELETLAAASGQVHLSPGTAPELSLILRENDSGLVAKALARVSGQVVEPTASEIGTDHQ